MVAACRNDVRATDEPLGLDDLRVGRRVSPEAIALLTILGVVPQPPSAAPRTPEAVVVRPPANEYS